MIAMECNWQKKVTSLEKVMKINKAYWDDNMTMFNVGAKLGVSKPVIDRVLFQSRIEWIKFKSKYSTEPLTHKANNETVSLR